MTGFALFFFLNCWSEPGDQRVHWFGKQRLKEFSEGRPISSELATREGPAFEKDLEPVASANGFNPEGKEGVDIERMACGVLFLFFLLFCCAHRWYAQLNLPRLAY